MESRKWIIQFFPSFKYCNKNLVLDFLKTLKISYKKKYKEFKKFNKLYKII